MDPGCYFLGDIGCLNENLNKIVSHIGSKFRIGDSLLSKGSYLWQEEEGHGQGRQAHHDSRL